MLGLFNIIITLLILHTLSYMVGPKKSAILTCGLFAFLSDREAGSSKFSWDKFNHLGLDNDERGGDSIGRVVGETIDKFISKKAKTTYHEYVINTKNSEPSHIAIGHTRKASIGEISQNTTQPVVLDLPDGGGRFIMVHNGTLHNWEELAEKYNISKIGKSDSMVFAEIIMNHGFGVLLEYQGAAAIIIKDDREPDTLKIFKGESKNYGNKATEERPLYFYQENDNSMYISSKEDGLYFIGGDTSNVFEFESNRLYTIYAGQIVHELTVDYDRSECSQVKVYVAPVTTYAKPYSRNSDNFSTKRHYGYGDCYDDWEDTQYAISYPESTGSLVNIKRDPIVNPNNPNKIVCARLRYYFFMDGKTASFANGPINLNISGIKSEGKLAYGQKTYYFYRGIMLKDANSYYLAKQKFGKARTFIDNELNIMQLSEFSVYPICTIECQYPIYENARSWSESSKIVGQSVAPYFNGELNMLFSCKTYKFNSGGLQSVKFNAIQTSPKFEDHGIISQQKTIALPQSTISTGLVKKQHPVNCTCNECYSEIRDIFKNDKYYQEQKELNDAIRDYQEDCDEEDIDETTDTMLEESLDSGIQAILLAIDGCRTDLEISGLTSRKTKMAISNLLKLEDVLLELNSFKKHSLIASYEQF